VQDPKLLAVEKKLVEKEWTMQGEVQNFERPKDGLLNIQTEFETVKQLDQFDVANFKNKQEKVDSYFELKTQLEALVKQRIADST